MGTAMANESLSDRTCTIVAPGIFVRPPQDRQLIILWLPYFDHGIIMLQRSAPMLLRLTNRGRQSYRPRICL